MAHSRNNWFQRPLKMDRRDFLELSLAFGLNSLIWSSAPAAAATFRGRPPKVLVLGAGIAGLAAARELVRLGAKVSILEAKSRIGGRLWTDVSLGAPLDMGAMSLPREEPIPFLESLPNESPKQFSIDYSNMVLFDHVGNEISERKTQQFFVEFEEILEEARELYPQRKVSVSVRNGVRRVMRQKLLLEDREWLMNWTLSWREALTGLDLREVSLHDPAATALSVDSEQFLSDGYGSILSEIAAGIDIRLEQRIERIEHTHRGVQVITQQGQFNADCAVVTLPAPVLRENPGLFSPELPVEKMAALRQMKFGLINRVALRFSKAFWPRDEEIFGYASKTPSEFPIFLNLKHSRDIPMLMAVCAGDYALALEKMTDAEIRDRILAILEDLFSPNLPTLEGMIVTRWHEDPFAGCAKVFAEEEANRTIFQTLSEPIENHLFFAGDATHFEHPGTVLGAYLSGIREAQRIAEGL